MPYYILDSKRDPNLENYPCKETVIRNLKTQKGTVDDININPALP